MAACPASLDTLAALTLEGRFLPFTQNDWYEFAGAEPGARIYRCDSYTAIHLPDTGEYEVSTWDEGTFESRAWIVADGELTEI